MLIVNDEQRLRAGIGSLGKRCQYCSLELVDHLRATPNGEHTPIILMSARMPREGVWECQLRVLPKPFRFKALLRLVCEQLPPETSHSRLAGVVRRKLL